MMKWKQIPQVNAPGTQISTQIRENKLFLRYQKISHKLFLIFENVTSICLGYIPNTLWEGGRGGEWGEVAPLSPRSQMAAVSGAAPGPSREQSQEIWTSSHLPHAGS